MRRILAIETSARQGSLALLEDLPGEPAATRTVREVQLPAELRTAQALAPALRDLLAETGWRPDSIAITAVTTGPGSFTGLRIGVTAAKTWAYATGSEVLGLGTLAVLAAQVPPHAEARLWTVLDAQRDELFTACFTVAEGSWCEQQPTGIQQREAWLAALGKGDLVTGAVLERIAGQLPAGVSAVERALWAPRAETVGQLGWQRWQSGVRDDLWQLVPQYHRLSAAEEKWQARQGE